MDDALDKVRIIDILVGLARTPWVAGRPHLQKLTLVNFALVWLTLSDMLVEHIWKMRNKMIHSWIEFQT
eukprot:7082727-Karenia_brevis.AAC.1